MVSMDYMPGTTTLYGILYNNGFYLCTADLATGAQTSIGQLQNIYIDSIACPL